MHSLGKPQQTTTFFFISRISSSKFIQTTICLKYQIQVSQKKEKIYFKTLTDEILYMLSIVIKYNIFLFSFQPSSTKQNVDDILLNYFSEERFSISCELSTRQMMADNSTESASLSELQHEKTHLLTCATTNKDLNQPAHPCSLTSLCCPHEETLYLWLSKMHPGKILVRLSKCRLILIFTKHTCPKVFFGKMSTGTIFSLSTDICLDKGGYLVNIFLISPQKHMLGALMSTNNICFHGEIENMLLVLIRSALMRCF